MSAEIDFGSSAKRLKRDSIDEKFFIFCKHVFTAKSPEITLGISKLDKLLSACKVRQDAVGKCIIAAEDDFKNY